MLFCFTLVEQMDIIKELYNRNSVFEKLTKESNLEITSFDSFDYYVYGNFSIFISELINYKKNKTISYRSPFSINEIEKHLKEISIELIIECGFKSISDILENDVNWLFRDLIETTFFEEIIELDNINCYFQKYFSQKNNLIWEKYKKEIS